MFIKLPRRGREPFDDQRPTIKHLTEMENRIMSALEDAINSLNDAITNANARFQNVGEVETALAAEREKYAALVALEEAEDVAQNQELADARAATDAALAEVTAAAASLQGLTDQVNSLGTVAAEEAPEAVSAENLTSSEPSASPETQSEPAPSEAPTETTGVPTEGGGPEEQLRNPDDPTSTENMNPNV